MQEESCCVPSYNLFYKGRSLGLCVGLVVIALENHEIDRLREKLKDSCVKHVCALYAHRKRTLISVCLWESLCEWWSYKKQNYAKTMRHWALTKQKKSQESIHLSTLCKHICIPTCKMAEHVHESPAICLILLRRSRTRSLGLTLSTCSWTSFWALNSVTRSCSVMDLSCLYQCLASDARKNKKASEDLLKKNLRYLQTPHLHARKRQSELCETEQASKGSGSSPNHQVCQQSAEIQNPRENGGKGKQDLLSLLIYSLQPSRNPILHYGT